MTERPCLQLLVDSLRRNGLRHSQFAVVAAATIHLKLLKLDAPVRTSVDRMRQKGEEQCNLMA